jgi:hypothetical protein
MDRHTTMFLTYWLILLSVLLSIVLCALWDVPQVTTPFEGVILALLVTILVGVSWEAGE